MRTVGTKIPDNIYEELKKRASSEGLSISGLLRRLIYEYVGMPEVNRVVNLEVNRDLPTREEFEELKRKVDELERELKRIAGISYFMNRKKR